MVLEVRHIKKSFNGRVVLDDINLSVAAGECVGVVGLSGCGKSTLAKIISRLIDYDSGEIFVDGELQMIFQLPEDSFNPRKTLGWSIAEPMRNRGFENISARIGELLGEVGLPVDYAKRYPHEVSGGECQRAAIARAISVNPKVLLCDEATSALDVTVQAQVVNLVKKLCREKNIACLFITHEIFILPKIADRVVVMHGGKIVEENSPAKIFDSPQSSFTKQLIEGGAFWRISANV